MVIYLYRWKLKAGKEKQFEQAWSYVTEQLRAQCQSRGSRLHKGDDGWWYGYAQWPSIETRDNAKINDTKYLEARDQMHDAIKESQPPVILQPVADFLT